MNVVLASSSPWRAQLLRQAGISCEILAPEVDEGAFPELNPVRRAEGLAALKARAAAARAPEGALVIGADQVAHLSGEILHKPGTLENQRAQLRALKGRTHTLVTGVCLLRGANELIFHESSHIAFRIDLSDAEVEAYLATGEGRQACGGYQIEGLGAQLIERIEGDWFNVVGLPILQLISALRRMGWRPWPGVEDGAG